MYMAHMHTILNENFADDGYVERGVELQQIINNAVNSDPNKTVSISQYQSNLLSDVSSGMGPGSKTAPGIKVLMDGRYDYLSNLTDFTNIKPVITNVRPSEESPAINTDVYITAEITNANVDGVYLGYRFDQYDRFTKISMYDDGQHGDGAANDGVFGASVLIEITSLQYYIFAENENIGMFSPERAEHEFHSLMASINTIEKGDLVINEFMAKNSETVADQDGEYDDWIELFNNSENTLSLDNLYISDNPDNLLKWKFPDGTNISPKEYLILWADEDQKQDGLHTNFKLSAGGENLFLSYENGTVLESIEFGEQEEDMSYARVPNGTGNFVIQEPTFGKNNESGSSREEGIITGITSLNQNYPNPLQNSTTIDFSLSEPGYVTLEIYNSMGEKVSAISNGYYSNGNYQYNWNAENFPEGVYLISLKVDKTLYTKSMIVVR